MRFATVDECVGVWWQETKLPLTLAFDCPACGYATDVPHQFFDYAGEQICHSCFRWVLQVWGMVKYRHVGYSR